MELKKVLGIILLVLATMAVGFYFGTSFTGSWATGSDASKINMMIVSDHDASAPLYKLSIEYPQFRGVSDDFNNSIKNFVDSNLADFKTMTQENWTARQATRPSGTPENAPTQMYYFNISWEPAQINAHYISFILRMAAFEGGANENQQIITFNYDLTKNANVTLADLFPGKSDYLTTISTLARQQLTGSMNSNSDGNAPIGMINDGTTPTVENFKNFVFNDDVITIYFPKYQVGPGAFGEQQVTMVRDDQ